MKTFFLLYIADRFLHIVNTCLPWLWHEWASVESEDTSLLLADVQKVNDKRKFLSERVIYKCRAQHSVTEFDRLHL